MKRNIVFILGLLLISAMTVFAQETVSQNNVVASNNYRIKPGDRLVGKVLGEEEFGFEVIVDENGTFELPFVDKKVQAKCQTQSQVITEVKDYYSKFLRNPLLSIQVAEKSKPAPVTVFGEVVNPQRIELRREARLLELLAFSGGIKKDSAAGLVRVVRTQVPECSSEDVRADWERDTNGGLEAPTTLYSLSSIETARNEANPIIYPGDLIIVEEAPSVYVIGEVTALRELKITQEGLSLSEALAQSGGVRSTAKKKEIIIRRLKPNSKEREIIAVNYKAIEKGEQKDIMLEPEDIVIVDKTKKSIGQTILDIAMGSARGAANVLPQTILY